MSFYVRAFWRFVFVRQKVDAVARTAIEFPPIHKGASLNLDAATCRRATMCRVASCYYLFREEKKKKPNIGRSAMHLTRFILLATAAGCLSLGAGSEAKAAEYGFSSYALGQNAFGAGVTPPAGTYVTSATGFYTAHIDNSINFGGVVLDAERMWSSCPPRSMAFTCSIGRCWVAIWASRGDCPGRLYRSRCQDNGRAYLGAVQHRWRWIWRCRLQASTGLAARGFFAYRLRASGGSDRPL